MNYTTTELEIALEAGGLSAGLRYLNGRVNHRFTAIYRLEDMTLNNVSVVDKVTDDFDHTVLEKIPLSDSFCQFVIRDGYFRTAQTTGMEMLDGHPYQGVIESYVGLPLMTSQDKLYGSLCHFDFAKQALSDEEFEYLQRVALLLPQYL